MNISTRVRAVLALAGLALGAGGAAAQPFDVAICAAAGGAGACQSTDPRNKLMASGLFSTVDIIDVAVGTPTLVQLQNYDAVICWTNTTPQDTNAWGNVLADYVDMAAGAWWSRASPTAR